jgi:hypothetical protein
MRLLYLGVAALAGQTSGCTGFAFVLQPPPKFLELETWTDVPEGQVDCKAKVGEVLHLPLGPAMEYPGLYCKVRINGKAPEVPFFSISSRTTSYVFSAQQAGTYRVEIKGDPFFSPSPRVWTISVSE